MFLVYVGKEDIRVKGYADESFQTGRDNFRSQSNFVFMLNRAVVTWRSAKKETIVDSDIDS